MKKIVLLIICAFSPSLYAVGPILSGQPLWELSKRIGGTDDIIESKLDGLQSGCDATILSSADINSSGTIVIFQSGSYCLSEDIEADISVLGASCVSLDLNNRRIIGRIKLDSADDCSIHDGFIEPPSPTTALPPAGLEVSTSTDRILVQNVTVTCASSNDVAGRDGIEVRGNNVVLIGCEVTGGGGDSGNSGGRGIFLNGADSTVVRSCTISSGVGAQALSGGGGSGGNGIHVSDIATKIEIDGCTVFSTGAGGRGAFGANGGNGGHGIFIDSNCVDVAVHDCIIRNTGNGGPSGGGGGSAGVGGKAMDDNVAAGASESVVYRNVAYYITNAIRFDLQASGSEDGVAMVNPPDNRSIGNQFVNFYL